MNPKHAVLPWWIQPSGAFAVASVLTFATMAFSMGRLDDLGLYSEFSTDFQMVLVGTIAIYAAGFGIGRSAAAGLEIAPPKPAMLELLRVEGFVTGRVLAFVALGGYVLWGSLAVVRGLRPEHVLGVLRSETGVAFAIRDNYLTTVPGLTTATQFAMPAVILLIVTASNRTQTQTAVRLTGLLLCFGLARAVIASERLAIIELGFAVVYAWIVRPNGGRLKRGQALLPVALVAVALLFFVAAEAPRSFAGKVADGEQRSVVEFGVDRLVNYYATATANSQIILDPSNSLASEGPPIHTAGWLWSFPGVSAFVEYETNSGEALTSAWRADLRKYGNEEFTNPGGWTAPIADYGLFAGFAVALSVGVAFGLAWTVTSSGTPMSHAARALLLLTILEAPRLFYLGLGRSFPWVVALIIPMLFRIPGRQR